MLKEFSFTNCRSFKDESTLSMEANPALKDNFNFVVQRGSAKNTIHLNPVAAIYGCNAGGKTNIIRSLADAIENIRFGFNVETRNTTFMRGNDVITHKLVIVCENIEYDYEYAYKVSATEPEVLTESLWIRSLSAGALREQIFAREGSVIKTSVYKEKQMEKSLFDKIAVNTDVLIMKLAGEIGLKHFETFYDWCTAVEFDMRDLGEQARYTVLNDYAAELRADPTRMLEYKDFENFLIGVDPSITGVTIIPVGGAGNEQARFVLLRNSKPQPVPFFLEDESNGTKKLMELYPSIRQALQEGLLFVCDEIDTLLHPLVFRRIVDLFNDKETNKKGAQLIFTAHNTVVMNRECLRRDEINFVDKDENGQSSLFRLSEVVDEDGNKVRMDARYDRLYMAGFFGSIPDLFSDTAIVGSNENAAL